MYNNSHRPRFSGGRPFRGNNGGGNRSRRPAKKFDPSMFVKKASGEVKKEEYVSEFTFADFNLGTRIQQNIAARGYTVPTSIQDQALPHLIEGRDVIGVANTGTGKTAAFLIPLINKVDLDKSQRVLIVTPTRELAVQIEQELRQFSQNMNIYSVTCIGGVSMYPQVQKLQRRPNFVIGTPGRLRDLERQRKLNFAHFNNIVLDEVDQMLDMGFIPDVKYIASLLPEERQSLFFSATMPDSIRALVNTFVRDPITISVKTTDSHANIDQDVVRTQGNNKVDLLHEMLQQEGFDKVIVFLRTKRSTEKLSQILYDRGLETAAIHGNKSQNQRQRAIDMFKRNRIKVLLATDVASRGLDIDDVTHVINFDLPETYEDYIHRIGRTGRASKKGIALTFID